MFGFSWLRWLRTPGRRPGTIRKSPPKRGYRLTLERLETRLAPATHTWTGANAAVNPNWSNALNWTGGAPTAGAPADDLIFDTGATSKINNNDLINAAFSRITFNDAGYTLQGNDISLGGGAGIVLVSQNLALNDAINLGITFAGNSTVNVASSSMILTLAKPLTGAVSDILTKGQSGILVLSASNSNFLSQINVTGGILAISNPNALGAPGSAAQSYTTVQAGAELQVLPGAGTVNEYLLLNGNGANIGEGALHNAGGYNTWAGEIVLQTNSVLSAANTPILSATEAGTTVTITTAGPITGLAVGQIVTITNITSPGYNGSFVVTGVAGNTFTYTAAAGLFSPAVLGAGAGAATTLNVSGRISDSTASNLTKEGKGTIVFSRVGGNTYQGLTTIEDGILRIQDPLSLGFDGTDIDFIAGIHGNGTIVNRTTAIKFGTLQLQNVDPTRTGFIVAAGRAFNENLVLNGPGSNNNGALSNIASNINLTATILSATASGTTVTVTTSGGIGGLAVGQNVTISGITSANYNGTFVVTDVTGNTFKYTAAIAPAQTPAVLGATPKAAFALASNNEWAGGVVLGSPPSASGFSVNIGAASNTALTISGVVSNPNGAFSLTKVDSGKLILNNANTYDTSTTVALGILNIRDSQALGPASSSTTTVNGTGAALELEVDRGLAPRPYPPPAVPRDLANDSIEGYFQTSSDGVKYQPGLTVSETLILNGQGILVNALGTGALHSISGVNKWINTVTSNGAFIGVDADPIPSSTVIHPSRILAEPTPLLLLGRMSWPAPTLLKEPVRRLVAVGPMVRL